MRCCLPGCTHMHGGDDVDVRERGVCCYDLVQRPTISKKRKKVSRFVRMNYAVAIVFAWWVKVERRAVAKDLLTKPSAGVPRWHANWF